ncbi:MAG: chemotaxis protein CheW [Candidatus Acidiferrum sp.]
MSSSSRSSVTAAKLRSAFDRERALPLSSDAREQTENLIAIRVSRDAYALRVAEISGFATDRGIVAFPSPIRELLGVAAVRGVLVPVYSLAGLLGYGEESGDARWLALCGTEEPFALAFSGFEGYSRIAHTQLCPAEKRDATRTFVTHVARTPEMVRAVISIPLFRQAIRERCRSGSVSKER